MINKTLELKTKKIVDSLYVWNYKTNFKWNWLEFIDFREYDFWDNVKNIDFLKSEITNKTLVRVYEEKRDLSVYFVIDLSDSFFEKYFSEKSKFDILLECFYFVWLSAIKSGDNFGWVLNYKKNKIFPAKKWKQNFVNIIKYLENINLEINKKNNFISELKNLFNKKENNFTNNLSYFNKLHIKNSLVFFFTDKIDFDLKDLKIISNKNDLVFCNIFNSFENNLDWKGFIWVNDSSLKIDLNDKEKIEKYKNLREEKILNLKKNLNKYKAKYLWLDETKNIQKEFYKLFM